MLGFFCVSAPSRAARGLTMEIDTDLAAHLRNPDHRIDHEGEEQPCADDRQYFPVFLHNSWEPSTCLPFSVFSFHAFVCLYSLQKYVMT